MTTTIEQRARELASYLACVSYDCVEKIIQALCAERDAMTTQLCATLYPNGIKHPQQTEWDWMLEDVKSLNVIIDECDDRDECIRNAVLEEAAALLSIETQTTRHIAQSIRALKTKSKVK